MTHQLFALCTLLVVTNKSSSILEDLDILRRLAKIGPDYAQSPDEDGITKAEGLAAADMLQNMHCLAVIFTCCYVCFMALPPYQV